MEERTGGRRKEKEGKREQQGKPCITIILGAKARHYKGASVLEPLYWSICIKVGRGYTHDYRANKYPYPHDRHAVKDSYPQYRNVTDDLCGLVKLCFVFIMVNFLCVLLLSC